MRRKIENEISFENFDREINETNELWTLANVRAWIEIIIHWNEIMSLFSSHFGSILKEESIQHNQISLQIMYEYGFIFKYGSIYASQTASATVFARNKKGQT